MFLLFITTRKSLAGISFERGACRCNLFVDWSLGEGDGPPNFSWTDRDGCMEQGLALVDRGGSVCEMGMPHHALRFVLYFRVKLDFPIVASSKLEFACRLDCWIP